MKDILLVGISVRAAAQSAVRSGHPIQALDSFGDSDIPATCRSLSLTRDFQGKIDEVKGSTTMRLYRCSLGLNFDEVIYCSGFENHPECVEGWEREGKIILGNSPDALRSVRNWDGLFSFLDSKGIPHPETLPVGELSQFDAGLMDSGEYVVKPVLSGGGHGIRSVADALDSGTTGDREPRPVLIQRLLSGIPASASFVSGPGEFKLLSTTMQLAGNYISPFRYCGNIAPLDAPARIRREMGRIAVEIAGEYGLLGSNGVDFILSDGRPFVLEVNPRPQGSLEVVEAAAGISVMDAHIKACRGEKVPVATRRSRLYHGRKVVFSPRELLTPSLSGLGFVRDVPPPGTPVSPCEPICTVVARSESMESCRGQLNELEKKVISLMVEPDPCRPSR